MIPNEILIAVFDNGTLKIIPQSPEILMYSPGDKFTVVRYRKEKTMISDSDKIKVMQAFIDGEEIEGRVVMDGNWISITKPFWNWLEWEFRVKPKPREFWIRIWSDNNISIYSAKPEPTPLNQIIRVREVLDDPT